MTRRHVSNAYELQQILWYVAGQSTVCQDRGVSCIYFIYHKLRPTVTAPLDKSLYAVVATTIRRAFDARSTRERLSLRSRCTSGCVVECRICNPEVAGSNLSLGYFAPRSTQPSIPPGSVNEYQLRLGRQRRVWLIPIADKRVGVQVKL